MTDRHADDAIWDDRNEGREPTLGLTVLALVVPIAGVLGYYYFRDFAERSWAQNFYYAVLCAWLPLTVFVSYLLPRWAGSLSVELPLNRGQWDAIRYGVLMAVVFALFPLQDDMTAAEVLSTYGTSFTLVFFVVSVGTLASEILLRRLSIWGGRQ